MTTPPTDQACKVSRSSKACQPFGTSPKSLDTLPYRASSKVSRGLIRPRERTACWQLKCASFLRGTDAPRHATMNRSRPVETSRPQLSKSSRPQGRSEKYTTQVPIPDSKLVILGLVCPEPCPTAEYRHADQDPVRLHGQHLPKSGRRGRFHSPNS